MNAVRLALLGVALGLISVTIPLANDAAIQSRATWAASKGSSLAKLREPAPDQASLRVKAAERTPLAQPQSVQQETMGAQDRAPSDRQAAASAQQRVGSGDQGSASNGPDATQTHPTTTPAWDIKPAATPTEPPRARPAVDLALRIVPTPSTPRVYVDSELRQAELRFVERLGAEGKSSGSSGGSDSGLRQPRLLPQSWRQPKDDYLDGSPATESGKSQVAPLVPVADPVSTPQASSGALAGCETDACFEPLGAWTMPQPWLAHRLGIRFGGWVDQGISVVTNNPADRYNGVLPFNDRDGEYQVNQLWMYMERATDTTDGGWDIGGRVDFIFGTDARFTKSIDGLEANWDQRQRFYQAALPQFYFDVAFNKLTLRMGKFWTLIGYEVVPAVDNFFYSHAYTHQYCEPYTHLGMLLIYQLNEHWTFSNGLHRGNDQFDDTDGLNALDYLGGVTWTGLDGRLSLSFAISATEQGPDIQQTIYSLVGTCQVTERLKYVIEHDNSQMTGAISAQGYGLNQYFLYQLNNTWAAGIRLEWFRDDDGTRVIPIGDGNRNTGPYIGDFYEITVGLNWTPHPNIRVRPEVRWDWFEPDTPGGIGPYDAGDRFDQFLFGCDLIVTY